MKYETFLNPTRSEYKYVEKISEYIVPFRDVIKEDILHNKFVKDLKLGTENIYFTIEGPDVYIIANTSFMSPSFFKTVVDNPKVFKKIAKRIKKFAPIKHVKYGIEGHKGNKFTI